MREIKFRGISLETNEWVYGGVWHQDNPERECSYICILKENKGVYNLTTVNVRHKSIVQYTGIKDKNEKEIYDGHILTANDNKHKWVVKWNDRGFYYLLSETDGHKRISDFSVNNIRTKKIIGNIYENKELLTTK